jgi:hypothetical protein
MPFKYTTAKVFVWAGAILFLPGFAHAASLEDFFKALMSLADSLVYIAMTLALAGFLWGVVRYILNAAKPDVRKEATNYMVYGIVSLFVLVSVWGIVFLFRNFFGFNELPGTQSGQQDPFQRTPLAPQERNSFDNNVDIIREYQAGFLESDSGDDDELLLQEAARAGRAYDELGVPVDSTDPIEFPSAFDNIGE